MMAVSTRIANERAALSDSLWTATANPGPDCPPLAGEAECDTVVIGGGFTGLSAALHLAEAGAERAPAGGRDPRLGRVGPQWRAGQSGAEA